MGLYWFLFLEINDGDNQEGYIDREDWIGGGCRGINTVESGDHGSRNCGCYGNFLAISGVEWWSTRQCFDGRLILTRIGVANCYNEDEKSTPATIDSGQRG